MKVIDPDEPCGSCGRKMEYRDGPNNIGFIGFECKPCRRIRAVHKTGLTRLPDSA